MAGPKDKRKKKDKDYSKEQKAINKKWVKRMDKTIKKLGLSNWDPDQPTKTALKQAGTMVAGTPFVVGMMGEKAIRAAKKKITGKAKGGMIIAPKSGSAHYKSKQSAKSIAKKYFKGGIN